MNDTPDTPHRGCATDCRQIRRLAAYPLSEARRILAKKLHRITDYQAVSLRQHMVDLETALRGQDAAEAERLLNSLEELLHGELRKVYKTPARDWIESMLLALAVALVLRFFFLEAFKIPSGSMYPTLYVGDHIFVSKIDYGVELPVARTKIATWGEPERGEVIVFRYPLNQSEDYIKRVIGLPGDEIRVAGRDVWINGRQVERTLVGPYEYPDTSGVTHHPERYRCRIGDNEFNVLYEYTPEDAGGEGRTYTVPDGHYFVMGDNRDHSSDSRVWGPVPRDHLKGDALFIWLAWSRIHGFLPGRIGDIIH